MFLTDISQHAICKLFAIVRQQNLWASVLRNQLLINSIQYSRGDSLSRIALAMSHPLGLSTITKIFWFPIWATSTFTIRSAETFLKGLGRNFCSLQLVFVSNHFFMPTQRATIQMPLNVFDHLQPIIIFLNE